jgi:hypothetical protein
MNKIILLLAALWFSIAGNLNAVEWQYSVPTESVSGTRRAYLWLPPDCQRVRGLLVGLQNMLERPVFEDPQIRRACAESGLGIVWIAPLTENNQEKLNQKFGPEAWPTLLQTLNDLAKESGSAEISNAPLLAVAHSAATPFVWGMGAQGPARIIAILPYKGWFTAHGPLDVPVFHVGSEYGEVGGTNWGETYLNDRKALLKMRGENERCLLGEFVDIGAGHFEWNPDAAKIIAMFIKKAVALRVPDSSGRRRGDESLTEKKLETPHVVSYELKPVDPNSGWLIDPEKLGTAEGKPVPAALLKADHKKFFWYFDEELARAVNDFMAAGLAKKPQVIDFVENGKPVPLEKGGMADLHPKFLEDGATFRVEATPLDKSPIARLYGGAEVGHASGPVQFRVSTGALKQTGPATFRVWLGRGGVERQSSPWEPWIMAWQPGNDEFRRADRPGHPWVYIVNKNGKPQTIDFPKIENQKLGTKTLKLKATSDSDLPVQFFIVSGPVELKDDDTIEFLPVPPRSRFPVRVIIGAYQWGRTVEPKLQSAGPVFQEFCIEK